MSTGVILIIDDDAQIVRIVREALEDEGYTVLFATGERAALEALAARPDLILLDLSLPGVDSDALCRRLRSDAAARGAGIVVLSGRHDLPQRVRDLPVDGYLPKPFDLDELYALAARWTGPRGPAGGHVS